MRKVSLEAVLAADAGLAMSGSAGAAVADGEAMAGEAAMFMLPSEAGDWPGIDGVIGLEGC